MGAVEPDDRNRDAWRKSADDLLKGGLRAEVDAGTAEHLAAGGLSGSPKGRPRGLPKGRRPKIEGPDNASAAVIEGRG